MKEKMKNKKMQAYACVVLIMCLVITSMMVRPRAASSVQRNLYVGNTLTLTYSNKSVQWSTSNKAIASVSKTSGKSTTVKGLKKGTVTIKAKSGSKVLASCVVNVKSNTLSINKSTASVKIGSSVSLTATSSATASNLKWSSSDKSIATVSSSGKSVTVKGKKTGTATITVKTVDGIKKTCKVTVKKASSTSSNSSNNNSNTSSNPTSVINKYFASNSQYTKISDGNGKFDKLNGHAATQQATYAAEGYLYNSTLSIATNGKYQYIWKNGSTYSGISWKNAISLSFTDTTFAVGENCGVLRVLNCSVPNCKFSWSSSNSNVVGIQTLNPDVSAIHVLAKTPGSAVITCRIDFPNGESTVLKSTVNVSDTVESNIKNGTVDMNSVMNKIANAYKSNKNVNWIPDVISPQVASAYGNTVLGSYGSYDIYYSEIDENTMENMYNPNNKYLNNPEEYIVYSGSQIFSNSYFMVEYQGHNDNGIQLAQVGVLSIPTVK